jgi:magnesium transporter
MIHTLAYTIDRQLVQNLPLDKLGAPHIAWYWVDFDVPNEQEMLLLRDHFQFHPLAIEDCFHFLQRPKMDHYDGYDFYVLHALNQLTLESEEVDLFVGKNYVVSFHLTKLREINAVRERVLTEPKAQERGIVFLTYLIIDHLVDQYFPAVYQIEDYLGALEDRHHDRRKARVLMDRVFEIRSDLLQIRRTVVPMRDLLYRILNTEDAERQPRSQRVFFTDVHDHLMKLAEMIDTNREMTADLRDNYISVNSYRMNSVMMTLTMMTTVFMPLTLIAGIYGMNFDNMPELHTRYGYYAVLGIMAFCGLMMALWFKRKGWFEES